MAFVELENVTKAYAGAGAAPVKALDGVSFTAEAGQWIAIMGPSGSGKTTLLNILGCLDQATSGAVRIDSVDTSTLTRAELARFRAETVGFVFQQFHLIPHLTALENVMLAQYFHSMTDEAEARRALERVGLARSRAASAFAAFRRRAAARGHRARAGERSEDHPGRRAHRQSGCGQ